MRQFIGECMKTKLVRTGVALFSAGWLIPLCLSVRLYLNFQRLELWPMVAGRPVLNSYPYLSASSTLFTLACVWLGVVILYWSGRVWSFLQHATD
jgi:hypothetical protein